MTVNLPARLREGVHIRLGYTVPTGKKTKSGEDATRPVASETFRFSSGVRRHLEALAEIYGGTVEDWEDGKALGQPWHVLTESSAVRILIAPVRGAFSQYFEMWSGGGCVRRCDNDTELINGQPCLCPLDGLERQQLAAKGEACKLTTRFVVMLPELDELVGARLETKSFNAGLELMGAELMFRTAVERGVFLPGELRIAKRVKVRDGRTNRFTVVELDVPLGKTMEALGMAGPEFEPKGALAAAPAAKGPVPREPVKEAAASASTGDRAAASDTAARQPVDREARQKAIADLAMSACLGDEKAAMDLVGIATGGRVHNVKLLNDDEQERVVALANAVDAKRCEIAYGIGGRDEPVLIDDTGELVDVVWNGNKIGDLVASAGGSPGARWKRALSGTGVTQASLLRQAAAIAGELSMEAPRNLEQLVDGELNRRLEEWLEERKSVTA